MKKLLKELLNTFEDDYRWRDTSFDQWWHGPVLLLGLLILGYLKSEKLQFFHRKCPSFYHEQGVMPFIFKAKVIDIKGNMHERQNWLTWVLLNNNNDTFNLTGSQSWGDLANTIAINDSILKEPGKLDIVLVKDSGERILYKYVCPE